MGCLITHELSSNPSSVNLFCISYASLGFIWEVGLARWLWLALDLISVQDFVFACCMLLCDVCHVRWGFALAYVISHIKLITMTFRPASNWLQQQQCVRRAPQYGYGLTCRIYMSLLHKTDSNTHSHSLRVSFSLSPSMIFSHTLSRPPLLWLSVCVSVCELLPNEAPVTSPIRPVGVDELTICVNCRSRRAKGSSVGIPVYSRALS